MPLRDYVGVLLRNWWIAVLGILLGCGGGLALATMTPPTYESTTQLYFVASVAPNINAVDLAQKLAPSYAEVVKSATVLGPVATKNDADTAEELSKRIKVEVPLDSVVMNVRVGSETPERAATLANAIADQFVKVFPTVVPKMPAGIGSMTPVVLARAIPALQPSAPQKRIYAAVGLFVGAVLALVIALIRDQSTVEKVRSPAVPVVRDEEFARTPGT